MTANRHDPDAEVVAADGGPRDAAPHGALDLVPTPPTPREMRQAMGSFASGVTVVTGLDGEEPVGFACQAFTSVSLDPPLVLFCADHRGRTWPRIRRSGRFCVNVLAEEQLDLCRRFGSSDGAKFAGLAWEPTRWGCPALPGVLLRVHAEITDIHLAGDHDVVIGHVRELETPGQHRPMVFFRGRFGVDADTDTGPADPFLVRWAWAEGWG